MERAWNNVDPLRNAEVFGAWGLDFVAYITIAELRLVAMYVSNSQFSCVFDLSDRSSRVDPIPQSKAALGSLGIESPHRQQHVLYILDWMELRMTLRDYTRPVGTATIPLF